MNTPQLKVNVLDYTQTASIPSGVEVYLSGVTRRGPIGDPSMAIDTYDKYLQVFGGAAPVSMFQNPEDTAKDFHIYVQRLLAYGARLRINRIAGAGADKGKPVQVSLPFIERTTNEAGQTVETVNQVPCFTVAAKYAGADYNGMYVEILPPSNGDKDHFFNMEIKWPRYPQYNESYQNLQLPDLQTYAQDQTYLDSVIKLTQLVDIEYMETNGEGPTEGVTMHADWTNKAGVHMGEFEAGEDIVVRFKVDIPNGYPAEKVMLKFFDRNTPPGTTINVKYITGFDDSGNPTTNEQLTWVGDGIEFYGPQDSGESGFDLIPDTGVLKGNSIPFQVNQTSGYHPQPMEVWLVRVSDHTTLAQASVDFAGGVVAQKAYYFNQPKAASVVPGKFYINPGTNGAKVSSEIPTNKDFLNTAPFDQLTGGRIIAIPGVYNMAAQSKWAGYAETRKDLVYMGSMDVDINGYEKAFDEVTPLANKQYCVMSCGGLSIIDPATGKTRYISEIADTIGLCVSTSNNRGPWFDPASKQSASIINAVGVRYNFGTPALSGALNDLANHGINAVVVRDGAIEWTSSYTMQQTDSVLSFASGVFLVLHLKGIIEPVLRSHLKEPCDIVTFKSIYRQLKTPLDALASTQNRALWKYEYLGDQDASSLDSLKVNKKEEVQIGKYKIFLKLWVIVPLIDVTLNMMLVMGDGEVGVEIG